ncbi:hypothetical protein JTE90_007280 [Oedothorax gibbosus]|uniref:Elongation factor Ts, mitochondrial n=1 Tax=Oedothorax gibbosus TaxID=931172 RepID=A0AAV6VNR1_9ARAC|nr:hypothetical protein JTE90_007280 [Oedothorax gibbosus]
MIGVFSRRFFHTSRAHLTTARSSALGKLRKSTGYSVSNCKRAVELFPDDIVKAEAWLHEEAKQKGWSKWAKVQTRTATQGVVGVFSTDKIGVMLEVNCETDFVAKNVDFHKFVENVLYGCMSHIGSLSSSEAVAKAVLDENQLNKIEHNSSTLGELVIDAFTKFNEKTVLKRAVCFKVKDDIKLSAVSHPSTSCPTLNGATLGKYGTILAYKNNNPEQEPEKELSLNLCHHIIGMNPSSIGELSEQDILNFTKKANSEVEETSETAQEIECSEKQETTVEDQNKPVENSEDAEDAVEGHETLNANVKDTEETRLLFQDFLLDSSVTVGETLYKTGVEIVEFERFECGETQIDEVKQQAASVGI